MVASESHGALFGFNRFHTGHVPDILRSLGNKLTVHRVRPLDVASQHRSIVCSVSVTRRSGRCESEPCSAGRATGKPRIIIGRTV